MKPYVHDAVLDMHMAREQLLAALEDVDDGWGRYVPYGERTLKELLAHLAAADRAWAVQAQGLLKSEGHDATPVSAGDAAALRERGIARGKALSVAELKAEMARRRKLLLSLYELLEPRHLAAALPSFGAHNSVRERIWRGYHDRMHAADVRRALRLRWYPQGLEYVPEVEHVVASLSPDATLYVAYSVDPVVWEEAAPVPGWTYRMLLAHIATGDWVLQTHLRALIDTGAPAAWPDIDAGNAERLAERAHTTHDTLTEEYLSMRHETMRLLAQVRPEHLAQPIDLWWKPEPRQSTMRVYLDGFHEHDHHHREQLRAGMKWARALRGK